MSKTNLVKQSSAGRRHKRTTFKKHPKGYMKVYAPYLPALIIFGLGVWIAVFQGGSNYGVLSLSNPQSPEALLELTNKERQNTNVRNLKLNQKLNQAAQAKAEDMVNKNYWSHVSPNGQEPWVFIEKSGYNYSKAGENLAYGFKTSEATISGWMNSPTHKRTMLDDGITEVGFGIANSSNYIDKGPQTITVGFYAQPTAAENTVNLINTTGTASSPQRLSFAQTIIGISNPMINFLAGAVLGLAAMYLLLKHSLGLRRRIKESEKFIARHPILDITLLSIAFLCFVVIQTAGYIY